MKSPDAKLISWTPNPMALIYHAFHHNRFGVPFPEKLERATYPQATFVLDLLREDWCGATEMALFTWQFVLPRSLHAQVRAHRHWSFFSESNQVIDPRTFAQDGEYYEIPDLNGPQRVIEHHAMLDAQNAYDKLRKEGVINALARGVLPLHFNLGLAAACNLRSLFNTVVQRRCHILQGTYWNPLLEIMKSEIMEKVDGRLGEIFELQPCDVRGTCFAPSEQKLRMKGKDPHEACPRYLELVSTRGRSNCCDNGCDGCLKYAVAKGEEVMRRNDR